MRTLIAIVIVSLPLTIAAQPLATELDDEIMDNVSVEYVECAAYFAVVQEGLSKSESPVVAAKYGEASDKAAQFGLLAAQQSRSEEMATKVTLARFEISLKAMRQTIENNYSNTALLSSKYSDNCVEAMADSAAMLNRWTEKITSTYEKAEQKKARTLRGRGAKGPG